jgi:hypothetical protein
MNELAGILPLLEGTVFEGIVFKARHAKTRQV